MTIVIFLGIVNILILIHELGHFIFAKQFKVKVREFAIGVGPVLFKKKIKGTIYSIRLIPFGGFNDIKGQEKREKGKGNFVDISFWQKVLVILGGIILNIILAIISFYGLLFASNFKFPVAFELPVYFANVRKVKNPGVIVVKVASNPVLKKLKVPFYLVAVNGKTIYSRQELLNILRRVKDGKVNLLIKSRDGEEMELANVPVKGGVLGIYLVPNEKFFLDYGGSRLLKIFSGPAMALDMLKANTVLLSRLVKQALKRHDLKPLSYSVSGPVGIYKVVEDGVSHRLGIPYFLQLIGLLSLSLAVFNLLPFPGLDGWHLFIITIQKLSRGRLYNETFYKYVTIGGLIVLIILSIIITVKDIKLFF